MGEEGSRVLNVPISGSIFEFAWLVGREAKRLNGWQDLHA